MQPPKADAVMRLWNSPSTKKYRDRALEALQDPATIQLLHDHAVALKEKVQEWQEKRLEERAEEGTRARKGYFGQPRLEARCRHMVTLLDSFAATAPEVAKALEPVRAGVLQVETALKVSAGLPLVKRKQAHFKIDDQLDEIERTVLAAVLGEGADKG